MGQFKTLALALAASLLVVACGGSDRVTYTSVKVMGDSLSDSGTFSALGAGSGYGRIFSVQGADHKIWTERVAASAGVASLCNVYQFTGTTFIANPTPGCTSYGVGGGRINNQASQGGANSPFSIIKQLQDGAATAGSYKASDLLLIDGGGNDAADLVGAYLQAPSDSAAAYAALLSSLLPAADVNTALTSGAASVAAIGGTYMTALADSFYDAIRTNALNKGATRVVILNAPGITLTPRFQMVLDSIAAAYGGGDAGATARAQSEALFDSWVRAFNSRLSTRAAVDSGTVLVVDFYGDLKKQLANPANYGLTNVTTPACPITSVGSDGLPAYNFETCTATALSAQTPPAGATGGTNWWKTYAFSDGFHPTPYGYQLMSNLVTSSLASVGWL